MTNAPGGGSLVTITDPEGYLFNVVFGQEPTNVEVSHPDKVVLNYTGEKSRRREFNRFEPGPAAVHKVCKKPISDFSSLIPHSDIKTDTNLILSLVISGIRPRNSTTSSTSTPPTSTFYPPTSSTSRTKAKGSS